MSKLAGVSRATWLMILGAAGLGLLALIAVAQRLSDRTEAGLTESRTPPSLEEGLVAVDEAQSRRALEVPVQPPAPEVIAEEPPPAPPAADFRFPEAYEPRPKTPSDVFEAMYGTMTLAEIAAQKGMVEVEHTAAMNRIADERYAAGLYEEYIVERQDPEVFEKEFKPNPNLPAWPEHQGLTSSQGSEVLPDGRVRFRRTIFPHEEYPGYYEQKDEIFWLIHRLSKLQKQQAGGG